MTSMPVMSEVKSTCSMIVFRRCELKCPHCEEEFGRIEYDAVGWIEFVDTVEKSEWVDSPEEERKLYCPKCFEVLDVDDLDVLGVPPHLR